MVYDIQGQRGEVLASGDQNDLQNRDEVYRGAKDEVYRGAKVFKIHP